jgi:alpha/beta superfamily hydrolase
MNQLTAQAVTFNAGDLALEGALHLPDKTPAPGVVVCHPHPLYGGDMDNNVVMAACQSLVERGIAALRFNFRGAGNSEGEHDGGEGEQDDIRGALDYVRSLPEIDDKRIGLIGYSFGAVVASEVASGDLRALGLVSPPLEFADIKLAWGCPALIVGGDMDHLAPVERLEIVSQTPGVELFIVSGADHSWWGCDDELGEALGQFFSNHMR